MAHRVGLFSCDSVGRPFVQMLEFCKERGYEGIELFENNDLGVPDLEVARRIRGKSLELDVAVCCMSKGADLMAQDQKTVVNMVKDYINVAEIAGAPYIHFTVFPGLAHNTLGVNRKKLIQTTTPAIRELCDYAGEKGISCLLEGQGYYANGLEAMVDLVSEVDHPNLGIAADLGNVICVDEEPERFVGYFAPLVRHVHVKDMDYSPVPREGGLPWRPTRGGNWFRRCDLGTGVVNIEKCLQILKKVGYTGNFVIENTVFNRLDKAAEDLKYMKNMVSRIFKEEEK